MPAFRNRRYRLILRGLSLLLALALAAGTSPVRAESPAEEEATREREAFVADNVVFTFYHELGHALIDLLDVPVLGKEEDAVDALAVLLSSRGRPPELADDMIVSAADSFAILDEWAAEDGEAFAFWGEHSLDPQRFFTIICLYYGGEPDELEGLADAAELPEERRDLCIDERIQIEEAWGAILERIDRTRETEFTKGLKLVKDPPLSEDHKAAAELIARSAALERAVSDFNAAFATPDTITVALSTCEEANAYYDPETRGITICYELLSEFADQIDWALENDF